jgi:hypothetical protein
MVRSRVSHSQLVLSTVQSSQAAVSSVAASWCRSALRHGLDPSRLPRQDRLDERALGQLRDANGELLAVATPVLDRLFSHVGQTGCGVIISDLDGMILDARSSAGDAPLFDAAGLVAGASWSEASEGTNGIGTCLVEGRPVTIHRHEHFASRNVDISCMDAPIFDPVGQIVAALDVSSARSDHGEPMARLISALVQDAARTIERDFFCQRYADARSCWPRARRGGRRCWRWIATIWWWAPPVPRVSISRWAWRRASIRVRWAMFWGVNKARWMTMAALFCVRHWRARAGMWRRRPNCWGSGGRPSIAGWSVPEWRDASASQVSRN